MTRAGALLLAVAAVAWARHLGQAGAAASVGTALAVGFTLLGAWVAGDLLRRLHLPRLTGYLLFGVLVGPYLANVITASMASQLQAITGLATTLIALIAGLTISLERLGKSLSAIVRLTTVTLAVVSIGIGTAAWFAWSWLPVAPESSGMTRAVIVCLLTIMVASVSPTMTAAVTTETGARGRLSELVLAVVVLADLVLLVLFSCGMQVARALLRPDVEGPNLLVRFAWETGGAVAFGALVGALFALYLRYIGREVTLALLAMCALLTQVGTTQQFEPLLAAVSAGLVIENLSVSQGDALRAAVQRGAPPVLIIFFVAIGSSLRVDALVALGPIALALAALRTALIRIGVRAGVNASGIDPRVGRHAWTGLISQAGITVGLASVVAAEFPGWGTQLQTLLIALIPIHELIGPMLFRRGLARAGEQEALARRPLLVVSNREPYLHVRREDGSVTWTSATGGVAVALDALMRERGGTWIAHGAGSADRYVVDAADKVLVPPEHPSYALRRLWLEEPTFSAYYGGFANEGLWPLCHVVDVRPRFRAEEWAAYRDVNERFAAAIDEELDSSETPVFLQDYHLALVAPALRARRRAVRTALFWHIPWPHPDRLRICPWRTELLEGLAANDLLAFQLERDRRNFLQAAEEQLGAEVDLEASRIWVRERPTTVISVPIGVDYDRIQDIGSADALRVEQQRLHRDLRLDAPLIGIGVDRLDYTKGIPERLAALDALVTRRPELRGRLTFVQIGVPSRSHLHGYAEIEAEITARIQEVNARHHVAGLPPLVAYRTAPLGIKSLVALYRLADFCIVSSLHDGMNLVAKEFVAARDDEGGVLVLSELAGAAQELQEAIIINPYDVDGFADALARAIDMPADQRRARMRALRRVVAGRNVFGWASDILEGLESLWTRPLHYAVRGWEDTSI
ncbi:MAG TPA: trehalose-6-phosphate synthase [Vicinamibacterales bacterium]|jgi:trehalose 6-phosphate synthase|nr:trehalose-6-phosphate synthase [Vicinamibacterales bacterium]